jgi:hypothetical protein
MTIQDGQESVRKRIHEEQPVDYIAYSRQSLLDDRKQRVLC